MQDIIKNRKLKNILVIQYNKKIKSDGKVKTITYICQ